MKKIKYLWILFLLVSWSCVDDNSKYGDIEIDEIKIEGIDDYREIEIGSKFTVQPTVITKFGDQSDLSYVWYKYNQEQTVADTLSFEKNLDVVIGDVLPGVETTLAFKVIDNRTGVYAKHTSKFITLGKYAGGTLMLCQKDGQYDLAMLKKDGTFYEDIYALANDGQKLGNQSKRIILTKSYPNNPLPYKAVVVTCDDETGGVYLDGDAFVRKSNMRDKFLFNEDMPEKLVITANYNGQGTEYLIVNGKVHGRDFGYSDNADWNPEVVVLANPTDYQAAEFVAQPTGSPFYAKPIFYDNLNGRFMANLNGGYFSFISGTEDDYSRFDPSNVGKGMELVASGCMNSTLNEIWALMKDTNKGEYVLLTYKFTYDTSDWPYKYSFVSLSKKVISSAACPGLYAATVFRPGNKAFVANSNPWKIVPQGVSDVLFYLSGNKVYAFNILNSSEGVLIDGNQENYLFTGMDCTEVPSPTAEAPDATIVQLTLSLKDQNQSDKQGGIAVYKLNNIGGLSAQKLYAKSGFCDEVIFTVEKQD